jgi:hypothetical protein
LRDLGGTQGFVAFSLALPQFFRTREIFDGVVAAKKVSLEGRKWIRTVANGIRVVQAP